MGDMTFNKSWTKCMLNPVKGNGEILIPYELNGKFNISFINKHLL